MRMVMRRPKVVHLLEVDRVDLLRLLGLDYHVPGDEGQSHDGHFRGGPLGDGPFVDRETQQEFALLLRPTEDMGQELDQVDSILDSVEQPERARPRAAAEWLDRFLRVEPFASRILHITPHDDVTYSKRCDRISQKKANS